MIRSTMRLWGLPEASVSGCSEGERRISDARKDEPKNFPSTDYGFPFWQQISQSFWDKEMEKGAEKNKSQLKNSSRC